MHVSIEHRFARTDVARFVDVYYSADFNSAVAPYARLREREVVETRVLDDGRVRRRVRMVPNVELPRPIVRLIQGAPIEYFEVSEYDPARRTARYWVESAAGDFLRVWGTITFVEDGDGVVRRIDGDVEVKVFGLGKAIEKLIAREVNGRYDAIQAFTQQYLDEQR